MPLPRLPWLLRSRPKPHVLARAAASTYISHLSDQPVSLELLDRLVRDIQEDQRELRGELNALRLRLCGLETAVLAGIGEITEAIRRLERMLAELLGRGG